MSKRALALGIESRLRTIYGDTSGNHIGVQRDLRPPPASGQWYVSIGKVSVSKGPTQSGDVNDQLYTVQIGITCKYGYAPQDRQTAEIIRPRTDMDFAGPTPATPQADWELTSPGIEDFADQIVAYLLEDYNVLNLADDYITGAGSTTNGFIEPFHQDTVSDVEEKPASWCGLESADEGQIQAVTITLSGARRIRMRGTL